MRLLKDTFTTDSMLVKNSIQAGLGGCRLIPTIIQPDEGISHLGDLTPVQVNKTHTPNVNDFSIVALPINTFADGGVHLGFDFAHEVSPLVDELIVAGRGVRSGGVLCHLPNRPQDARCAGDPQER